MTVEQQLRFQASFYPRWDRAREARLLADLELDIKRKIIELSLGDQQKLGVMPSAIARSWCYSMSR